MPLQTLRSLTNCCSWFRMSRKRPWAAPDGQTSISSIFQRSTKPKQPDVGWDMAELDEAMKPQNSLDEQERRDGTGQFSTRNQIDGSVRTHNPEFDMNILDENQFKIDERADAGERSVTLLFQCWFSPFGVLTRNQLGWRRSSGTNLWHWPPRIVETSPFKR
jgi:hypothetical protein